MQSKRDVNFLFFFEEEITDINYNSTAVFLYLLKNMRK